MALQTSANLSHSFGLSPKRTHHNCFRSCDFGCRERFDSQTVLDSKYEIGCLEPVCLFCVNERLSLGSFCSGDSTCQTVLADRQTLMSDSCAKILAPLTWWCWWFEHHQYSIFFHEPYFSNGIVCDEHSSTIVLSILCLNIK